ncbi:Ig-like domain-containing protein [Actinocrispum sp. NPDC049592]|uniref:L,D-transpeptidase n=1 Tax=Actinocrispum sp. NPDC049592 TaxID=3154835 RepID=UPI00342819E8
MKRLGRKGIIGIVLTAAALTACTGQQAVTTPVNKEAVTQAPATPNVQPANGTTDASPGGPVTATVADGTIDSVTLSTKDGKTVQGALSADHKTWTAGQALEYNKSYTWSGSATGGNGQHTEITGSFSTVKPKRTETGKLNVGDNKTYGIAMPIELKFDTKVTDRASVEKSLKVETSVPTEGSWAWLDDRRVHWRPKEFWKPNTQVKVTANLFGTSLGNGVYGKADVTSSFTIGREQTVIADTQAHRLIVKRDDKVMYDFPASYGLESDPGRVTTGGTHVVMEAFETKLMTNEKYGYENVPVKWAVRFYGNGEFIHAYDATKAQQGKVNVSHGCANLTTENAKKYFESQLTGDPVIVTGSKVQMSEQYDYSDWIVPWDKWQSRSALK